MNAAARLARLVRLLATDRDGERLAAVAALGRTLKAAGHDWHDLADAVERGWKAAGATREPAILRPWQATARDCLVGGSTRLTAAELDFLRTITMLPSEPSERQARWLDAIALSLGIAGKAAA